MNETLTKKDLVSRVSETAGLDHKTAKIALTAVMDGIQDALTSGHDVELRKFGVFEVQVRKSRIGRNPNSPENDIVIPERLVVKFKPGKVLKEKLAKLDIKKLAK